VLDGIIQYLYSVDINTTGWTLTSIIYSPLHTYAIRYSLLLLGYKPVQHVTLLNTVGYCNTGVSIVMLYYNIMGWAG
jgi:hypothetical protein